MCYQVMGYLKEHFQQKLIDYVENTVSENPMDILEEIEEPRLMFLKKIRLSNINRIIIGYTVINSMRNIFEMLSNIIKNNIDILMV